MSVALGLRTDSLARRLTCAFHSLQLTVSYTGSGGAEEAVQAEVNPGETYHIEAKEKNEGTDFRGPCEWSFSLGELVLTASMC